VKQDASNLDAIDRKMYHTALEVAKRKFSPEFMNRIDKVVVFRTLNTDHLRAILDLELLEVQRRILATQQEHPFAFHCTAEAKDFLLKEGTDARYGARHLKRAIERHLVYPISGLIASEQVRAGDTLRVDVASGGEGLVFVKEESLPASKFNAGAGTAMSSSSMSSESVSGRPFYRTAVRR
jgi:ATP-dependent Clp protease ATP-binding subunit ClpA